MYILMGSMKEKTQEEIPAFFDENNFRFEQISHPRYRFVNRRAPSIPVAWGTTQPLIDSIKDLRRSLS